MLKRLSAAKRSFSHILCPDAEFSFSEGEPLMKTKPSIKISFTVSSKKKYIVVQICFLTGGAEATCIIKMSAMEKRVSQWTP